MVKDILDKLFHNLKKFIFRDLMYTFSGTLIIFTFMMLFDLSLLQNNLNSLKQIFNLPEYVFIAIFILLSYIIGYTIQEIFSYVPFLNKTTYKKPKRFYSFLIKLFLVNGADTYNNLPDKINADKLSFCTDNHLSDKTKVRIDRRANMMLMGGAIGSGGIIISILILIKIILDNKMDLLLAGLIIIILSLSMFLINRIKNIQFYGYKILLNSCCKECKGNATKDETAK